MQEHTQLLPRSPGHLLKEVLLVDDASTMSHLGEELEQYMAQYPRYVGPDGTGVQALEGKQE